MTPEVAQPLSDEEVMQPPPPNASTRTLSDAEVMQPHGERAPWDESEPQREGGLMQTVPQALEWKAEWDKLHNVAVAESLRQARGTTKDYHSLKTIGTQKTKAMPIEDLVYDVGMNNGDDSAYYLSLGFRTVAIEANPELIEQAKARFARENASGRLIILNIGITDREGELPFWICEANSCWSSFDRANASLSNSPNHQIQVPCTRFETIVAQYGVPYFCKIDIQGNEFLCLEGLIPHNVPRFLSIEATNRELKTLDMVRALGYSLFKWISQSRTYLKIEDGSRSAIEGG